MFNKNNQKTQINKVSFVTSDINKSRGDRKKKVKYQTKDKNRQ